MKKFKYILFSLLFLAIFIPSFTLAEEQEHLTHTYTIPGLSDSYEFEYYSEDANHPINFSSWQSGSTKYTGFKTDDGSYGFFTAYYNNSDVISQFSNVLIYNGSSASLPTYINYTDCRLIKIVFTPFRDTLEVGQLTEYNEFVGYTDITGYTKSSISDVYKSMVNDNFGQFDDYFHISSNILLYYSSEDRPFTFMYAYNWSNASFSDALVRFNPSNQSFCQGSTTNCIYPNLQSGLVYNFEASYRASTGEITFSVNGETLSFANTSLKIGHYPLFAFYSTNVSSSSVDKIFHSRSALLRDLTIDNGEGKYITFYPAIYRTAENTYKTTVSFISSDGQDPSTYFSSHSYIKPTYYHSSEIFGNLFWYYDKPSSGGSSGSGGSGSGSSGEYDFVKKIYPTENNNFIRNYSQYIYAMYSARNKDHLGLYLTRYHKDSDVLNSYHLLFDPALNKTSSLSSDVSSDGIVSITMSNDLTLTNSITSIYDTTRYGGDSWTPANGGADLEEYLKPNNWWTYSTLYLDLSDTSVFDIIFKTNPINNKHYTLTDLGINNTIVFETITTSEPNVYDGKPIKFYISFVDYGDYVDYYVLLSLRNGEENSISTIYNCTPFKDLTKMTYYNSIEYLNMSIVYNQFQDAGTADIVQPGEDFNLSDTTIGNYEDMFHDSLIDESAAKQLNAIDLFGSSVNDLIGSLSSLNNTLSDLLANLEMRSVQYDIYLNSFNDKDFVKASEFMKTELQWIYDNTPFKIPINIGLSTSIVMAVIF